MAIKQALGKTAVDITEVYSPPRVVQFADKHGLTPGHSIDIKCCDEQGNPWDLNEHKQRNKFIQLVRQTKPILVIGSPKCTKFLQLQNFNENKGDYKFQAEQKQLKSC